MAFDTTVAVAKEITTVSVFEQPVAAIVSVKIYEVVFIGLTDGFEEVDENP